MSSHAHLLVYRDSSKPQRSARNTRYSATNAVPLAWYALFQPADLVQVSLRYGVELSPATTVARAIENLQPRLPVLAALASVQAMSLASELGAQLAHFKPTDQIRIATDGLGSPWTSGQRDEIVAMLSAFETLDELSLMRMLLHIGVLGSEGDTVDIHFYQREGTSEREREALFINAITGWPTGEGRDGLVAASQRSPTEEEPSIPERKAPRPLRDYRETDVYEVGDRLQHPALGRGVVEVLGPASMMVLFRDRSSRELPCGVGAALPVRKYETSQSYALGERIQHPNHGVGLVVEATETSLRVRFRFRAPLVSLAHRQSLEGVPLYSPRERFGVGEMLAHPVFGKGTVRETKETSIVVCFDDGSVRTLARVKP